MSPFYSIDVDLVFPHPTLRDPDGLLAIGGSLTPETLLLAYRWGIFPWYQEGQPVLWWWITPRLMVRPHKVHISHSVRNSINRKQFNVTFDQDFVGVIHRCSSISRRGQEGGTWITPEMIDAYISLHKLGFAHSVEVYQNNVLVGGLYGIALGKIFFGESMFADETNASKVGFIFLANHLASLNYDWIDCQQDTPHMRTLGGELVNEDEFLQILRDNQLYLLKNQDSGFRNAI